MTELEKLYALRDKATSRIESAQRNITSIQNEIAELDGRIRYNKGELSIAEYLLGYVNQFIGELEKDGEK